MIQNLQHSEVFTLASKITYNQDHVNKQVLVKNDKVVMILFAFEKGQQLPTHQTTAEAFVQVIEGSGQFTIDEKTYHVQQGESLIMPSNIPHSVLACENFKMLLTQVF